MADTVGFGTDLRGHRPGPERCGLNAQHPILSMESQHLESMNSKRRSFVSLQTVALHACFGATIRSQTIPFAPNLL